MLDCPTLPVMTEAWRDHLRHGDIVLFRFPLAEEGERTKPKVRPCLILDIEEIGGERLALLAYGTTSHRRTNAGYELHVRRRAEYLAAGLDEPTRFGGARRILVPLKHRGFVAQEETLSPVIGQLDGEAFERMNAIRARIHATRGIAAERRGTKGRRRGGAVRGRDFTVETRKAPKQRRAITGRRP